ncbi:MAG: DNA-3-methyladenine glycosylase 2 family protein [Deltaproteobacteria bacterium]|nr:DNA-3-methyladenine glycosylase 2 family protein [Deltaproteobacteria bacterium]
MTVRLNKKALIKAVEYLEVRDRQLKLAVSKYGPPPLWMREEGFKTLIYIILEQQVSLASAKAAYEKLLWKIGSITPVNFLKLSDTELKLIGFSRQKTSYSRNLAEATITERLNLTALSDLNDPQAKEQLMNIKGIGPWTADIYLLMALGRPDIWPNGDIALASAVQKLKGAASRPSFEEINRMSLKWKPWRAVAARILWHYYLSERK